MTSTTTIDSPIGPLRLLAEDGALTGLHLHDQRHAPSVDAAWREDRSVFGDIAAQLDDYFEGSLQEFSVPLRPLGTDFQRAVWSALRSVRFACTASYAAIANQIERPRAMRAVGQANGRNPIAIVIPCHRIIGASGMLTGYGGGLDRKQWLLGHERKVAGITGGTLW